MSRAEGTVNSTAADDEGLARLHGGGATAYQSHSRANGGVPALLIRPLGGSTALWGSFRSILAETLHVVSFDHRGCGRSSAAPVWGTTQGLARDGLSVLDHLALDRAHVFGISLGGMTATWLAILEPARVAGRCLAATPARGLELSRSGLRRELGLAACFARPRAEVEASLVDRVLSRRFREAHPDETRRIEGLLQAEPASRAALLGHALAAVRHDARRELSRIRAPTLVLAGDGDHLLGIEPGRALAARIPGASFEIIPGSGHDLTLEQPLVTAARVARFFHGAARS